MALRTRIPDFEEVNPIYAGALVSFYTVLNGVKTATLATLYADETSDTLLENPQQLSSEGAFAQPVYIDEAVIGVVTGLGAGDHDTGIITPAVDDGEMRALAAGVRALAEDARNSSQPLSSLLAALAALTMAADRLPYFTSASAAALTAFTSFARTLLDDADAAAARTTLGVAIGSDVQAFDADLSAIAALSSTGLAVRTASNTWAQRSIAGTSNEITATNGDGVSGNPTLSLPSALTFTGKTVTGGTFSGATLSGTTTLPGSGQIDSAGKIGIGVTPDHQLTILKSVAADWLAKLSNASASGISGFGFYDNSDAWKGYIGYDNGDSGYGKLYGQSGVFWKIIADNIERIRVDSNGLTVKATGNTSSETAQLIGQAANGTEVFRVLNAANGNGLRIINGGASDIAMQTGVTGLTSSGEQWRVTHSASPNRCAYAQGSNGGNPIIGTTGGHLNLDPNGSNTVVISGLPTSAAGLPTGGLWNNSGVLNVA